MTHESRESEVLAKRWHKFWKYASIASAISATAGLFFSTGAIYWHSKAEKEHQKEIDRIDEDVPLASGVEFIRTGADGIDPSGVNDIH